jgi:PAS domain S-box-containing protein
VIAPDSWSDDPVPGGVLDSLINNCPSPVWVKDLRGRYVLVNRAFADMFGREPASLAGKTDRELYPGNPEIARDIEKRERRVLKDGAARRFEEMAVVKGIPLPFQTLRFPLRDKEGAIYAIGGAAYELTGVLDLQTRLAQTESSFESLMQAVPYVVASYDRELRFIFVNDEAEKATGIPKERFKDRTNRELGFPSNLVALWDGAIRKIFQTGRPAKMEFSFPTPEGPRRYEAQMTAQRARNGSVSSVIAVGVDITPRVEAEQRAKSLLKATLELVEQPYEQDIYRFIGLKIKEFLGQGVVSVHAYDPEERDIRIMKVFGLSRSLKKDVERMLRARLEGMVFPGVADYVEEGFLKGELVPIQGGLYEAFLSTVPKKTCRALERLLGIEQIHVIGLRSQGQVFGNITIVGTKESRLHKDTIETFINQAAIALARRRAEEQITDTNRRLRQLTAHIQNAREEERKKLAREMHDELGQALTGLKIDLTWLQKQLQENEPAAAKIAEMQELIDTTNRTIRRIAAELRPVLLDQMGLPAAIEFETNSFRARSNIPVSFICVPREQRVDEETGIALFRVLQEGLTNVLRHARATKVSVKLLQHENTLELEIADNGRGIAREQVQDPLSLGLVGMRERMDYLQGTLQITGKRNRGTRITVSVPLERTERTNLDPERPGSSGPEPRY